MQVKWKNCDIECTVDEFEELYVRGIIDPSVIPHKPKEELEGYFVPVYGCQIPMPDPGTIVLTPGRHLGPGDTVELNLCKKASDAVPDAVAELAMTEATAEVFQPGLVADGGSNDDAIPAPIPSDAAGSSSASEDSGPGDHSSICYQTIKALGFDNDVFMDQFRDISNPALRDAAIKLLDGHNYPTDYTSCLIAKYLLHGTLEVGTKLDDANSFAVNCKDGSICLYRKSPYRHSARLKIIPTKGEAHVELEILRTFNEADQSKFVFRSSDYALPLVEFISVCAQTWPAFSEDEYLSYVNDKKSSCW